MIDLCTQSALPLLPPPLRLLLAPWGYPPARARLTDLRRAAHQGDVSAQFTLGWMYEHGDDVPQDHREAATWYKRAADQDNATALNVVGVLYATGQGVPKDPREAVIWYHRAADIGYAPAQGHQQAQRMIDVLTVRPLPGPFDPYKPSTDDAGLIQRASERAAANVLDRLQPPVPNHHEPRPHRRADESPPTGHYQSPQTTRQGDDRHRGPLTADHDRPYRRSPGRPR